MLLHQRKRMKLKTSSKNQLLASTGRQKPLVSAKSKAVALLARREHSQVELRAKLLQRGYNASEVDEAIQWAMLHKFQSDERFKLGLFRRRAPTFGDRAISAELELHGLDGLSASGAQLQSQNEFGADLLESEEDRAYEWIKRRQLSRLAAVFEVSCNAEPGQLLALKSKVYKALSMRGFEFGSIDRAWRRILAEFKTNA